jgi:hypothetical protein
MVAFVMVGLFVRLSRKKWQMQSLMHCPHLCKLPYVLHLHRHPYRREKNLSQHSILPPKFRSWGANIIN